MLRNHRIHFEIHAFDQLKIQLRNPAQIELDPAHVQTVNSNFKEPQLQSHNDMCPNINSSYFRASWQAKVIACSYGPASHRCPFHCHLIAVEAEKELCSPKLLHFQKSNNTRSNERP